MILSRFLNFFGSSALDIFGVRTCPVCGNELLTDEDALCIKCLATLPRTNHRHLAVRLADVFANAIAPQGVTMAWFDYDSESPYADIVRQAKYNDSPSMACYLGYMFGTEIMRHYHPLPVDVLLPVPMHWRKRMRRGYNQSLEIARGLSRATGIAVGDNLLARKSHGTQTHKGDDARRHNVEGIFEVIHPHELDGLRIAIVDDIITTGATIAECVARISTSGAHPLSIGAMALGATVKKR